LRTSELLVVSCLRLWVHAYCGCTCGYPDWHEGLERAGIDIAGRTGFDTVWRIVATTALRTLDVRPIYCMHLGEDEGRFLSLIGSLQHDQALDAESVLAQWCPPTSVRRALTAAQAFALALAACRLHLPAGHLQETAPAAPGLTSLSMHAQRIH
jgi:hypothetical protein